MAEQTVARSRLTDLRSSSTTGAVTYDFVTALVRAQLGPDHAALFSEPVLSNEPGFLEWRCHMLGAVRPLAALSNAEAGQILSRLRTLVRDILDLADRLDNSGQAEDRRRALTLRDALQVPVAETAIHAVGNAPCLILWSYLSDHAESGGRGQLENYLFGQPQQEPQPGTHAVQAVSGTTNPRIVQRFALSGERLTISRNPGPGKIVIDHPGIAERHAEYRVENGALTLRDLGSRSGTWVNGERLSGERTIAPDDRVDIGGYRLDYDGEEVAIAESGSAACLSLHNVTREVRVAGKPLKILDDVSIDIPAGEFVCIIGMSGSGKSTLMNAMSGRARPTSGTVTWNDLDLHRNFDLVKQSMAMVPQYNLLHETLTLERALDYTARLRLPKDTRAAERSEVIGDSLENVGLGERKSVRISRLSGGQKRRASLAGELLNKPSLLFLDEMTSGLDEHTDAEIMAMLRTLADNGMTIVCVTHTLANIAANCHRLIVMAEGGVMVYSGAPDQAPAHFGVERLADIFSAVPERPVSEWRALHDGDASTKARTQEPSRQAGSTRTSRSAWTALRQIGILSRRNVSLLASDPQIWTMALVQSTLIGLLTGYAFSDFGSEGIQVSSKIALLLMLCMSGLWIGCNAASKDIVGELQIFQHECDVNLSTFAFVLSKLLVTGLFTALQIAVVFAIVYGLADSMPGDPMAQLGLAVLATLVGCTLGLLISSLTITTEQAATIVPLFLVPQLILCGIVVPNLPELADGISQIAVTSNVLVDTMKAVYIEVDGPVFEMNPDTGQPGKLEARAILDGTAIAAGHGLVALVMAIIIMVCRNSRRQNA